MAYDYNYREAVKDDLVDLIKSEYMDRLNEFEDLEEFREKVEEDAWNSDSVAGNASGSYTFSTYVAEEHLAHNWDLLQEALADFGSEFDLDKGAEYYDVTIRCWMLGQVIDDAIEECDISEDDPRFNDNQEVTA